MTNSFQLLITDDPKAFWPFDPEEAADDFNDIMRTNIDWVGIDISCDTVRLKNGKFLFDATVEDSTPEKVIAEIKKVFPEMEIKNITKEKKKK